MYAKYFLAQQFDISAAAGFYEAWHVEIFGGPVFLGDCSTVIATPIEK